jgi:transcriptional regulator with XRE-family HTH domain
MGIMPICAEYRALDEVEQTDDTPPTYYLREWRRASGLKQNEVERILGWPRSRLSNLELGVAVVSDEVLELLASVYGCEPADLKHPVARELLRDALGYRAPKQQQKPAWPITDPIVATLTKVMTDLFRIRGELRTVKTESLSRLETIDNQLAAMTRDTAEAIKNTAQTAKRIEAASAILKKVIDPPVPPAEPLPDDVEK